MNKRALYNAIMEKVAVQVKKAINEADNSVPTSFMSDDDVLELINPELIITDEADGTIYVDLSDLSVIPAEIIEELLFEITHAGKIEEEQLIDTDVAIVYYYIEANENSPILLRSADYHEITVKAEADFNIKVENYFPGSNGTYFDPPELPELEISDDIYVYNVKLGDDNGNSIDINDEDVINTIKDNLDGSQIEDGICEYFKENYEPDDDEPDYDMD